MQLQPPTGHDARIAWVDYGKGICILLVVLMHSTLGLGEAAGHEGWMHYAVAFAQPFRIPAFFFFSGLLLSRTIDQDWRTFADRKILHFVYFYLLWLAIQLVIKTGFAGSDGFAQLPAVFAYRLVEPFGTLWFIYILPLFYLATRLLRRLPPLLLWLLAAGLESLRIDTGWLAIDEFAARYVYFVSGYLLAPIAFRLAARAVEFPLWSLSALALWACLNAVLVFPRMPDIGLSKYAGVPGVSLLLGLAGAAALIAISAFLARGGWALWVKTCGQLSIVIYLAFFLPMAITRAVLLKLGYPDIGSGSLIVAAVACATPLAVHALIKNTPLNFLFERPRFLRLGKRAGQPRLQAAE